MWYFLDSVLSKAWMTQYKLITLQQDVWKAATAFAETKEIRPDVRDAMKGQDFPRYISWINFMPYIWSLASNNAIILILFSVVWL